LRSNSQSIVSQLGDTIWALKKDALSLTAISDRVKIVIQRIQNNYPEVTIDVFENIETDHLLSPAHAFHLFQIMQEAIINALRHSGGTLINVSLETTEHEQWKIVVEDNGKGITNQETGAGGGNGLINMQTRAEHAGCQISWQRKIPRGTSVIIQS
jgi:signal transduction histidine kinase